MARPRALHRFGRCSTNPTIGPLAVSRLGHPGASRATSPSTASSPGSSPATCSPNPTTLPQQPRDRGLPRRQVLDRERRDRRQYKDEYMVERTDKARTAFLGLTVGCARATTTSTIRSRSATTTRSARSSTATTSRAPMRRASAVSKAGRRCRGRTTRRPPGCAKRPQN